MADILYIDCNRSNSIKSDENTNEWEFKLHDEALSLPAGTQVSIQESFINKKGIGGNTIVLEEDFKTTIKYCYYINHSPNFTPNTYTQDGQLLGSYNLFSSTLYTTGFWNVFQNTRKRDFKDLPVEEDPANPYVMAKNNASFQLHGGFEKPLIACKITDYTNNPYHAINNPTGMKFPARSTNYPNGEHNNDDKNDRTGGTIEPVIGSTTIFLPKGSYSVDEIAQLIEDQLTGKLTDVENSNFNQDFIQKKILERTYRGTLENDGTTIMTTCLPYELKKTDGTARTDILNYRMPPRYPPDPNDPIVPNPSFEIPYYGELGTNAQNYPNRQPDNVNNRFRPLFFMKPSDWNDCRETFLRQKEWNDGDFTPVNRTSNPPVAPDTEQKIVAYLKRSELWNYWRQSQDSIGYNANKDRLAINSKGLYHIFRNNDFYNQARIPANPPPIDQYVYTPQSNGVYIGAPELQFKWNSESSAFEFNNLHFPYRFPSHDQLGDAIPEGGREGVLFRKVAEEERYRTINGVKKYIDDRDLSALETPMGSNGGIAIFNWGDEVAKRYGDVDRTDINKYAQTPQAQNMWSFEEHFTSKDLAREAWKHTLWYRLGFTYDQLQNRDRWTQGNFSDEVGSNNTRLFGATTRPDINTSIIPTISSTYNPKVLKPGSLENVRPRIFGNLDTSRAFEKLDTTAQENPFPGVAPDNPTYNNSLSYTNSMFPNSTCCPVETEGRPLTGQLLPTLSTEGYYLITSDIIDGYKDRIKRGTPISLLGVVPISNLSSQDFIQTRNQIVHTIQNQQVINSIKIKVLKPDLTAPFLEENSSVILKIVRPIQHIPLHIGDIDQRSEKDKEEHPKR